MIAFLLGILLGSLDLSQAEQAYHAGFYKEALSRYQAALSQPDVAQGPVLYNLGNCAHRLGRYSEALFYYRRAKLRMPRDKALKFNLSLTEQQLGLDPEGSESFRASILALVDSFTPLELLMLVVSLKCVGLMGFVFLRRNRPARNTMVLLVFIALAGAARLVQTQWFPGPLAGVVLKREIALRSEPHTSLTITQTIKAGETVGVKEMSDRWIRIIHTQGSGWTERSGVGVVE
jgi:hypothetical protein